MPRCTPTVLGHAAIAVDGASRDGRHMATVPEPSAREANDLGSDWPGKAGAWLGGRVRMRSFFS
ncbi:hypothetical protein SGPA1_50831 [Streptomyces misionensis JCM 4497]